MENEQIMENFAEKCRPAEKNAKGQGSLGRKQMNLLQIKEFLIAFWCKMKGMGTQNCMEIASKMTIR